MQNSHIIVRYAIQKTLHWLNIGLVIPVLVLLQLEKGLDLFQIGVVMASYGGLVILFEIPTGGLADAIGRKRVYMLSFLLKGITLFTLLFAHSFMPVLIAFIVYGVSRALDSGSLDAWFVDEFKLQYPDKNLQRPLALIDVCVLIGLGFGSLAGGFLPDTAGIILSERTGLDRYAGNLLAALVIMIITGIYTLLFIHEDTGHLKQTSLKEGLHQFPVLIKTSVQYGYKDRVIFLLLLTTVALGFGLSSLETLWQPRVQELIGTQHTGSWIYGALSAGYFLAAALGSLIIIPIAKRMEDRYPILLFVNRLIFGLMYGVLALQTGLIGFAAWYIILFVFNGTNSSPHDALLNSAIPAHRRSTMLSLSSFSLQIGGVAGSLLGGLLARSVSIQAAWLTAMGILLLSAFCYIAVQKRSR